MRILLILLGLLGLSGFSGINYFIQVNTFKTVPAEIFKAQLATRKGILIDVRTPEEFSQNHLAGAVNLNFYDPDFTASLKRLSAGKTTFIYCASGGRSSKAATLLKDLSQSGVYNLQGGIVAWQKAGLPVVK